MKAMILAAGRGKRMGSLTMDRPKPLLKVGSKTLIEHQIDRLVQNGIYDIVINLGYLGLQIKDYLGDGSRYGVKITYSSESETGLETGGGVYQALPLLGEKPFILTNADIYTDFPFESLFNLSVEFAHLVMVENPSFNTKGDFSLLQKQVLSGGDYTFSGISVVSPNLFKTESAGFYPIAPIFKRFISLGLVTGELYKGVWFDVGTPDRLSYVSEKFDG